MAGPTVPTDGMVLRENTVLAPGVYHLPSGITLGADGITLDGAGALLVGAGREGAGVRVENRSGVTVRGLRLSEYRHGIDARGCTGLALRHNHISGTAEVLPNTIFLNIWLGPDEAYGGGILLRDCLDSEVEGNDLQHQQSGLLTYHCKRLRVLNNQCSYNSGCGVHLYGTCDSVFEGNFADYCSRFEPREGGLHFGHMGADAAGFLAVYGSCRNVFRRNAARMGGDGFFLAGLTPGGLKLGCDENLFEENDGSLSPNIAFEATFCRGNVFRGNYAGRCNYGFWLGYSWDTVVDDNRLVLNRQAGIAVENGRGFMVRGNNFQGNTHGVLLWSHTVEEFETLFPDSLTSHDWTIAGNTFTRCGKGIRIAADQDHGIRPLPEGQRGRPRTRPHSHRITVNDIQDNRVGVELCSTDRTLIEGNILSRNVEANIRVEDTLDTTIRNNLGAAGGYL